MRAIVAGFEERIFLEGAAGFIGRGQGNRDDFEIRRG
jgi:hypothetical protein